MKKKSSGMVKKNMSGKAKADEYLRNMGVDKKFSFNKPKAKKKASKKK